MMTVFKIRSIYLFLYMAFAVWRVYYNIFLEQEGFIGAQIGTLNAIMQASIFLVVTLWGVYADHHGIRPTLRIGVLITAVLIFFLGKANSYVALLVYIPILSFFYHPMGPLTDALAMQYAETEKKHSYGSFRLWGSLGWALASIMGGLLFVKLPLKYIFPLSALLFLFAIPFLSTRKRKKVFKPHFERLHFRELAKNKSLMWFTALVALYGVICSPVNSYLNLYFSAIHAPNSTIGYAYAIMALSEIPLFIIGNRLLKKIGLHKIILIGMLTMFIRFLLYGIFPTIAIALATGALQGISLAFFLVGSIEYIGRIMPPGKQATGQSIIWGSYLGIGQTLGNLLIGFLIDKIGMVAVMQLFIGGSAICLLVAFLYFKMYRKNLQVD